jgi:hypothetical protein
LARWIGDADWLHIEQCGGQIVIPLQFDIIHAKPVYPSKLAITWEDSFSQVIEVGHILCRHPTLEMLNNREVFESMSVVYDGRAIEWANGADFCADALRLWAEEQAETTRILA